MSPLTTVNFVYKLYNAYYPFLFALLLPCSYAYLHSQKQDEKSQD